MLAEKTKIEISPNIKSQIEELAQFISDETVKADKAADCSNWEIFYRYNETFNRIAVEIGYDVEAERNEDWTAVALINAQITAPSWYEGKSREWLRKARRILKVACEVEGKCVADAALEEISLRHLSYEKCKIIATSSLPIVEKKELWGLLEQENPTCRELRVEVRDRGDAHKYLKSSKGSKAKGIEEGEGDELLDDDAVKAIATEFIERAKSGEISEAEKLIAEIVMRVRR